MILWYFMVGIEMFSTVMLYYVVTDLNIAIHVMKYTLGCGALAGADLWTGLLDPIQI